MPRGILTAALSLALLTPVLAQEDALARDEAAIRLRVEVLKSDSPATRDAAAAEIRALVAKYSNGTINIREPDGGEARWRARLRQVVPGSTPVADVERLLQPLRLGASSGSGRGGTQRYILDYHWQAIVTFQISANGTPSVVAAAPTLERIGTIVLGPVPPVNFTGEWTQYFANGQVAARTPFKSGVVVGVVRTYHDNGRPASEESYDPTSHLRVGPTPRWTREGTPQPDPTVR